MAEDIYDGYLYPDSHWLYGLERNKRFWNFMRKFVAPFIQRRMQFTCKPCRPRSKSCLVLCNHATDYDPFLIGIMFPRYLRFVATERLLRSKLLGPLTSWVMNPIPRRKASGASDTIEYIKSNLALGISVCMFAEGVRTMNGRTGFISPNTAKLVKECEGGLVTVRLTRGYMVTPLWAKYKRKGPTSAKMVREYSREELDAMTESEIAAHIAEDLSYNVWEDQLNRNIPYKCKAPAEGLENALYICPECFKVGSLKSKGADFMCSCGYNVTVNEYGFFTGRKSKFKTILDWDIWQHNFIAERSEYWKENPDELICSDSGVSIKEIDGKREKAIVGGATMALYPDRIEFSLSEPLFSMRFDDITKMNNFRSRSLLLTCQGKYYEISKKENWPVFSYVALWRMITGRSYIV